MLGKGFAVRIYDRHVSLARLMGANKEYIEKEIPHISRLMCGSAEELVSSSEVIVVSNRSQEFPEALTRCRPNQTVIDLVRIVEGLEKGNYYGICW
jgi:GDP-mannose 6-dehydrogenase